MSWEIAVVMGVLGIVGCLFWQSFSLSEENWAIKLLTYLLGWVGMIWLIGIMKTILDEQTTVPSRVMSMLDVGYLFMLWTFIGLFVYWVIMHSIAYWKANYGRAEGRIRGMGKDLPSIEEGLPR